VSITLAESVVEVRSLLRDHAGLLADDAVLTAWLDQGQKDVAALTLCLQQRTTFTNADNPQALTANQRSYPLALAVGAGGLGLPTALQVLHVLLNGLPLWQWTPHMMGFADIVNTRSGGTPAYYYEFAQDVTFIPYPNAAFLAATFSLDVVYAAQPAPWTAGASALPPGFDELPIFFAAARVAMQRRHWPLVAQWQGHYLAQLATYRVASLLQYATPQAHREQPVRIERDDEPHRLLMLERQRVAQRRRFQRVGGM
jgi:hypothetical protein